LLRGAPDRYRCPYRSDCRHGFLPNSAARSPRRSPSGSRPASRHSE
jgi:hypothetical protein